MAAGFATAPSVVSPPTFQQHYQAAAQYPTPLNSGPASPADLSPTSPRTIPPPSHLPIHTRQLRPPKSPLYVPAVLRPTEKPVRSSPPKTGSSSGLASPGGLSRRDTGWSFDADVSRIRTEEWNRESWGPIEGPPTRNHWQSDASAPVCTAPVCQKPFSFLDRRHHCRRCGFIFCSQHSSHSVQLNQHALFHPDASFYRACDACFGLYKHWDTTRASRTNSESSQGGDAAGVAGATKNKSVVGLLDVPGQGQGQGLGQRVTSYVGSVPKDWNWSTF
ncbi:hypothetical protein W97_01414 [Coniosporium apollinis CBS 100218]|uniref:FYVE-type domain-containing protein n=1 Tax=Coniosporium apollinis (strain CBS 100218) TaxID=1168221 RepID=R7YK66_CONA1|nr:uncharacterized protein W97_01414 [Coniosporium apollinis CBS 100218]EON62194.1 hypothetical protein W97_01414 [Coniosporium apollinis CBS 100218]